MTAARSIRRVWPIALSPGPRCSFERSTMRPHGFLQGAVLLVDPVDPGVALGALHLAVEAVIVRPVLERAERLLVDEVGAVADAALRPVLLGQRLVARRVHPVVDHDVVVIHRHPDVPGIARDPRIRARWADLMERHDEMVAADVHLRLAERPDAGIEIAVIGDIDDELRRLAADERARRLHAAARRVVGQAGGAGSARARCRCRPPAPATSCIPR